ncbi:MAG: rod shape-determining protein RodA [Candidatus Eutrophobiaceae bacterium]
MIEKRGILQRMHIDPLLLFYLMAICILGLFTLYSASGQQLPVVARQSLRMVFAFAAMLAVAQISLKTLEQWAFWLYVVGLILLVAVQFIGDVGKGAQRWLEFGTLRFQPSEFLKLSVPLIIAAYLANEEPPLGLKQTSVCLVLLGIPIYLILRQPDLGTALLICIPSLSVLFLAGFPWRYIWVAAGLGLIGAPIYWQLFMHEYQRGRVLTFLDPGREPLGAGYQTIQSQIAIGSGSVRGKGWLEGTQSHLEFLPERVTDFIFAVYCEEFGLFGFLILLGMYFCILSRCMSIVWNAQSSFGCLYGTSLVISFFSYLVVNMGMASGILPVVGIPLPLVSLGGTSMMSMMIGFGILMAIRSQRRFMKL